MLRLGAFLVRADRGGGYKLLRIAQSRGWLDKVVRYRVSPVVTLDVPIFRPENRWTAARVSAYERELVDDLSAAARAAARPPVLVDCGADIGTISVLVTARSSRVGQVVAIEPDPDSHVFLEREHRPPARRRAGGARGGGGLQPARLAAPPHRRLESPRAVTSRPSRTATSPS